MCRTAAVLHQVKGCQQAVETTRIRVTRVLRAHVKVAADDNWARVGDERFQNGCKFVEKQRRRFLRTWPVDVHDDNWAAERSQSNADHFECAASWHRESRTFQVLAEDDGDAATTSGSTRDIYDCITRWCGES